MPSSVRRLTRCSTVAKLCQPIVVRVSSFAVVVSPQRTVEVISALLPLSIRRSIACSLPMASVSMLTLNKLHPLPKTHWYSLVFCPPVPQISSAAESAAFLTPSQPGPPFQHPSHSTVRRTRCSELRCSSHLSAET